MTAAAQARAARSQLQKTITLYTTTTTIRDPSIFNRINHDTVLTIIKVLKLHTSDHTCGYVALLPRVGKYLVCDRARFQSFLDRASIVEGLEKWHGFVPNNTEDECTVRGFLCRVFDGAYGHDFCSGCLRRSSNQYIEGRLRFCGKCVGPWLRWSKLSEQELSRLWILPFRDWEHAGVGKYAGGFKCFDHDTFYNHESLSFRIHNRGILELRQDAADPSKSAELGKNLCAYMAWKAKIHLRGRVDDSMENAVGTIHKIMGYLYRNGIDDHGLCNIANSDYVDRLDTFASQNSTVRLLESCAAGNHSYILTTLTPETIRKSLLDIDIYEFSAQWILSMLRHRVSDEETRLTNRIKLYLGGKIIMEDIFSAIQDHLEELVVEAAEEMKVNARTKGLPWMEWSEYVKKTRNEIDGLLFMDPIVPEPRMSAKQHNVEAFGQIIRDDAVPQLDDKIGLIVHLAAARRLRRDLGDPEFPWCARKVIDKYRVLFRVPELGCVPSWIADMDVYGRVQTTKGALEVEGATIIHRSAHFLVYQLRKKRDFRQIS